MREFCEQCNKKVKVKWYRGNKLVDYKGLKVSRRETVVYCKKCRGDINSKKMFLYDEKMWKKKTDILDNLICFNYKEIYPEEIEEEKKEDVVSLEIEHYHKATIPECCKNCPNYKECEINMCHCILPSLERGY